MYKTNRDSHSGGKKFGAKRFGDKPSFGGKAPWKRDSRDFADRPSFKATCAECGNACTVPFRPNGSKPVLCSNCFGGSKPAGRGDFRKPFEKRSYSEPRSSGNSDMTEQLNAINSKLDRIIVALDALELE